MAAIFYVCVSLNFHSFFDHPFIRFTSIKDDAHVKYTRFRNIHSVQLKKKANVYRTNMEALVAAIHSLQLHSLWEKDKNGMYTDIFPFPSKLQNDLDKFKEQMSKTCELVGVNFVKTKNDAFALKIRNEGNLLFAESHLISAMEKYNRSLCFAENGSDHIGLAYANRSACYFKLEMYNECLIDIDLAKMANYPEHLLPKLEKRKDECLKAIAEGKQYEINMPKLSYEPHAMFPGMANVLEFKVDELGRHIITTKDLKIGDTILLEDIYVGETIATKFEKCAMCLKSNANLIPCSTCTFTLLCHDRCKNFDLHRLECGFCEHPVFADREPSSLVISVIRLILMAIKMFQSVDDLINFVEGVIPANRLEIPSLSNDQAIYRAFLLSGFDCINVDESNCYAYYTSSLAIPQIASTFSTTKDRRFLMHLVGYYYALIIKGMYLETVSYFVVNPTCTLSTSILKPFFNSVCTPNVMVYSTNGSIIGKVVDSIKSGERVLVQRMHSLDLTPPQINIFMQQMPFLNPCKTLCGYCNYGEHKIMMELCEELARDMMAYDPDYLFMKQKAPIFSEWIDQVDRKNFEERCLQFLSTFAKTGWYPELTFMTFTYMDMVKRCPTSVFGKFRYFVSQVPEVKRYLK